MTDVDVQDKKTEFRALINNILTALILMVMTWVGVNITQMKESMAIGATNDAITDIRIANLQSSSIRQAHVMEKHLGDCEKRWLRIERIMRQQGFYNDQVQR